MEMMSQMMSQSKSQQGVGDACAKMMPQFADSQDSGSECFEMISRMAASCCGIQQEGDKIIKEA
jgi:hypothetical protein